jgi:hypothetical protein
LREERRHSWEKDWIKGVIKGVIKEGMKAGEGVWREERKGDLLVILFFLFQHFSRVSQFRRDITHFACQCAYFFLYFK